MYKHSELTRKIIGVAMKVHREVGPGFKERVYHNAMDIALPEVGLESEREKNLR
jgi:GxxExxY protein